MSLMTSVLNALPLLTPPPDTLLAEYAQEEPQPGRSPFARLRQLLREDGRDLFALLTYTVMVGLLSLAVPLATQALVNTIAAGVFLQPLVVLSLIVLACLTLAGLLELVQLALAERIQQRIFARVALGLAMRLPFIRQSALSGEYAPQLVNRFFEVVTVQKTFAKMLLIAPSAALQILVGLLLLAFYSPYLLAFNIFLILFIAFVWGWLGLGGLQTSIKESSQKYRVAEWLAELARCQTGFKMSGVPGFPVERTDALVLDYLHYRREHFRVLFRQSAGNVLFRAVANAGILAIGGWLVIAGQLTLGQLIAAELVVLSILSALDKLIPMLEEVYDLLTALDKIGRVLDLPMERRQGVAVPEKGAGAGVVCRGVRFSYRPDTEILSGLNLSLTSGERVSLVGASGVGKSTLAGLLCGLHRPSHGLVTINSVEVRDADLDSLRRIVGLVGDTNEIFEGTVEENIVLGRPGITREDIVWALDLTQLTDELAGLPDGLQTLLVSEGRNLSRGQVQRLLLARALVSRPQLLLLDEAFTGIDEKDKLQILDGIYEEDLGWTILDISHDPEVVMRSQTVHVLERGRIAESGEPYRLLSQPDSLFRRLFPGLPRI